MFEHIYPLYIEFKNDDLKNKLETLFQTHDRHFDKHLLNSDSSLTEEELLPLLEHALHDSNTQYFEYINNMFLKLIDTEFILELIEIAVIYENQNANTVGNEDDSKVARLVRGTSRESSPQVSWLSYIAILKDDSTFLYLFLGYRQNAVCFVKW